LKGVKELVGVEGVNSFIVR